LRLKKVCIGLGLAALLDHAAQHVFKIHLKHPTSGQQFYHIFGISENLPSRLHLELPKISAFALLRFDRADDVLQLCHRVQT
jgi:hypothetical protein